MVLKQSIPAAQQELTPRQQRDIARLIKDTDKGCASYFNDRCAEKSRECIQINEDTLCCRYFIQYVLPIEEALCAELLGEGTRTCRVCGQPFSPGSNRAIYCPECAKRERKKQEATRKRKDRVKRPHIEKLDPS